MRGFFITSQKNKFYHWLCSLLVCVLSFSLMLSPTASYAQSINLLNLPVPGTMVGLSPVFNPAIVTGIKIYPDNPLQFDFIIDIGDDQLQGEALRKESQKLINYFMATLTVPEDEMWVNLSPYEKDRIIAEGLSYTEMGRDMLAQDYMLKQLTASLMYPEKDFGKEFWNRVYSKAQAEYGTTEIPMNTFNKIWIVPDEAVVYVNDTNVFVVENHLKVMLEEDYLALESNVGSTKHGLGNITKDDIEAVSGVSGEIIREVLLPEIEKEVNEGKNFSNLRQMYNSMLLATWYKKNLKESLLGQIYADKNKVNGIELDDKEMKQKIYDRYVEAFEKGVYNYIKEDIDSVTQEIIPRKYFSGGLDDYLSEDGNARFLEATGNVPAALVAKVERPHVTATVKGEALGNDEKNSSPVTSNEAQPPKLSKAELDLLGNEPTKQERNDIRIKAQAIQIQRALGMSAVDAEGFANQVIADLDSGAVKLKGEELHILDGVGEDAKVIGRIDRKLAEKYRFPHETANFVFVTPEGKVVAQLRNKSNYDDHLAMGGGHLEVGQSHENG
ncbi:MAG: hypothetical protein KAR20_04980, partial [Candidatus Heimdallarchaeota archaeon]|nr:hypothetical protein [Candidatus Heimdallarchaeota archaeon]